MSFVRINIAVKPNAEVIDEAIKLSAEINQNSEAFFVLDGENFLPHCTLYSPEFPEEHLDHIFIEVSHIVQQTTPFMAIADKSLSSHVGYVDVAIEKSPEWISLHETVVKTLNPLRDNHLRDKYKQPNELAKYSKEQQENIQSYGYAEVFNDFRPHLTLNRLKDVASAKEIAANIQFPLTGFEVDTIALYEMGDHGTCVKLIKEFSMK